MGLKAKMFEENKNNHNIKIAHFGFQPPRANLLYKRTAHSSCSVGSFRGVMVEAVGFQAYKDFLEY